LKRINGIKLGTYVNNVPVPTEVDVTLIDGTASKLELTFTKQYGLHYLQMMVGLEAHGRYDSLIVINGQNEISST
jgi:hypothetical protein